MERCLITGSSGFIGKSLSQELTNQGHQVIRGDREGSCPEVDYIFDLAAYGNLHGQNDLAETYRANVYRLAKLVNTTGYKGLVVTSSNSVKLRIGMYYQASKLAAEGLARVAAQTQPVAIVRPFSVTGIGEQSVHLIPKLIRSCMFGEEMPFVPEPIHDFIDVSDVAKAYILIAKQADQAPGQLFEVGWGNCYSNAEVKDLVERITGRKANIRLVDSLRTHDTSDRYVADNASTLQIGWRPTKTLKQSIWDMVEKYDREYI